MEVRAYEVSPFVMTLDMLSDTSGITNSSLVHSLSLASQSSSLNGIWQVNFGSIKKVKAVLVYCE